MRGIAAQLELGQDQPCKSICIDMMRDLLVSRLNFPVLKVLAFHVPWSWCLKASPVIRMFSNPQVFSCSMLLSWHEEVPDCGKEKPHV